MVHFRIFIIVRFFYRFVSCKYLRILITCVKTVIVECLIIVQIHHVQIILTNQLGTSVGGTKYVDAGTLMNNYAHIFDLRLLIILILWCILNLLLQEGQSSRRLAMNFFVVCVMMLRRILWSHHASICSVSRV